MTDTGSIERVRAVIAGLHPVPEDPAAPLEMDSLTTVMLVEALEDELGIRVTARDVIPENFASLAALAAYVDRKREHHPQ